MENNSAIGPEKRGVADFEWSPDYLSAHYVGRRAQIPYWCVSENNTYEPYVKRALYLVEAVNTTEGGYDDEMTFDLKYVDFDSYAPDVLPQLCSITRVGSPGEIVTKNNREIWVYGDGSLNDDQTMSFVLS